MQPVEHKFDPRRDADLFEQANQVLIPTISGLQERDPAAVPEIYEKSYRLIFYLAIPAFVVLVVVSPLVCAIWLGRYEPLFIEFVALLAAGWLVNVLSNPAYVVALGTGALRWISIGCVLTAALNAGLGVVAGKFFGGPAVVAASVASLIFGYALIITEYHIRNRVSFGALIPPASAATLTTSGVVALVFIPFFHAARADSIFSVRMTLGLAAALFIMIVPMWLHPMRRRVWNWVTSRATA